MNKFSKINVKKLEFNDTGIVENKLWVYMTEAQGISNRLQGLYYDYNNIINRLKSDYLKEYIENNDINWLKELIKLRKNLSILFHYEQVGTALRYWIMKIQDKLYFNIWAENSEFLNNKTYRKIMEFTDNLLEKLEVLLENVSKTRDIIKELIKEEYFKDDEKWFEELKKDIATEVNIYWEYQLRWCELAFKGDFKTSILRYPKIDLQIMKAIIL